MKGGGVGEVPEASSSLAARSLCPQPGPKREGHTFCPLLIHRYGSKGIFPLCPTRSGNPVLGEK